MVALLIVPSVMEGALEKVPPEFPSAGRSIAEQLRSWWWKFVGEGAELAKVKHGWDITTVTSGRDDVEAKEVRDVLSEFTPIHGYSGSLIPGIVECFQYGRVDRIFLAIVPSLGFCGVIYFSTNYRRFKLADLIRLHLDPDHVVDLHLLRHRAGDSNGYQCEQCSSHTFTSEHLDLY